MNRLLVSFFALAAIAALAAPAATEPRRFSVLPDGTVHDESTALLWAQQDNNKGRADPRGQRSSWASASRYCSTSRLAGFDDWRLPTEREAASLYAPKGGENSLFVKRRTAALRSLASESYRAMTETKAFAPSEIEISSPWLWTSEVTQTTYSLATGFVGLNEKDYKIPGFEGVALCVRKFSVSSNEATRFERDKKSAILTDKKLRLMWSATDNGRGTTPTAKQVKDGALNLDYGQARKYCDDLSLGGRTDWILPTAADLRSLFSPTHTGVSVSETAKGPAATVRVPNVFKLTGVYYWTQDVHMMEATIVNLADASVTSVLIGMKLPGRALCLAPLSLESAAQAPQISHRFVQQDGLVVDVQLGLLWTRTDNGLGKSMTRAQSTTGGYALNWTAASTYCKGLRLGGFNDWRLPTVAEATSLYSEAPDSAAVPMLGETAKVKIMSPFQLSGYGTWTSEHASPNAKFVIYGDGSANSHKIESAEYYHRALCTRTASAR